MKSQKKEKLTKVVERRNDDPIKPDDQLHLTAEELDEFYGNIFYVKEPIKLASRVIYDNKSRSFVTQTDKNIYVTANVKSTLLFHGSTEAETQLENDLCKKYESPDVDDDKSIVEIEEEQKQEEEEEGIYKNEDDNIEENAAEEMGEEFENGEEENNDEMNEMEEQIIIPEVQLPQLPKKSFTITKKKSGSSLYSLPIQKRCVFVKLANKFNFTNRYSQNKKCILRDIATNTQVTKMVGFNEDISPAKIYDSYIEDYARQQEEKEREKREKMTSLVTKKTKSTKHHEVQSRDQILLNVMIMFDKILSLNETDAIAQDFRYYDDPSDQYRSKGEGTVMLMWTMVYDKAKDLFVTDISWNPYYFDLFAVTLGIPQGHRPFIETPDLGYVCLWSLKNTSFPEYVTQTHSAAICVSFHIEHTNILAVGLRDGSVAVYNVKLQTTEPQYKSTSDETKHMACVRQVIWCADLVSGEMNFYSVSEDGTVCQWVLLQNEMVKIVKMALLLDSPKIELCGIKQPYYAKGTTLTFNPQDSEIYFVGTMEGYVFKCNVEWNSYMQRFKAHLMPVIRINFNKYNSNIFLTCSEDNLVKLWEDKNEDPLFTFDLKTALSDVCWSPFSSTSFTVTTTTNCRIVIYDLDVSAYEAVCDQLVHPADEYRLTRVAFDKRVPLVVIGSSKSMIVTFKLSPNLRTTLKSPKKGEQIPSEILEQNKLDEVLNQVRK
ncbi:Six-bladed beta-propeller, TolB-like,WD40-repeat-containing domain,WD40 repeat [Cinara cedri]|uniref:Six-bladed beta-propeller, TolB-like,WD40-repeat-containing domain,WD40 repeat n=1 Tax=Cinara cedri TaxID=506608 RepID=A0A5E4NJM2_9HEMI|nr:Six-bladed beta-propeller, TolB-like,WD40-repeat-containing domain,WD40 repeat [Cinara cedri]